MNKREFEYILQNGESYLIEFKERVNNSLAREMTAFANASGGRIFLGVTDKGGTRGVEITNINNALHFIKQELRVAYEMTGTARRKEIYEIPLDAIREAVINAVVHRDYFLDGSHTVIEIFDDRVEIANPGGLPRGLSEKEFGKRAVRRNPLIASLLHRIDFVENMGTGINKIRTLIKKAGLPQPRFEFGDFYTVIFPRILVPADAKTPRKTPGKTPLQILEIISKQPTLTIPEIAKMIKKSDSATERAIRKLREANLVKRIGPAKGGHWEVPESTE